MTALELMKADAETCNRALRRSMGYGQNFTEETARRLSEKVKGRREAVKALHDEGLPNIQIAALLKIARDTVARDLREMKRGELNQ